MAESSFPLIIQLKADDTFTSTSVSPVYSTLVNRPVQLSRSGSPSIVPLPQRSVQLSRPGSPSILPFSHRPAQIPQSDPLPIVSLSPNGLLIPFKPADKPSVNSNRSRLRPFSGFTSNGRNYDLIQEQIRERGKLLDRLKQQENGRTASLPVISAGNVAKTSSNSTRSTTPPTPPALPPQRPRPPPFSISQPSIPSFPSTFPSTGVNPLTPSAPKLNPPSSSSSSSSSSSKSSKSSTNAPSSGPSNYTRQPFGDNSYGPVLSGPSSAYSSLQP